MVGPTATLAFGAYLAIHGQVTAGAIVTLLIYQSRLTAPFGALSQLQITLSTLQVSVRRVLELIDLPEESSGESVFEPGDISVEHVGMRRSDRAILEAVNLVIRRGRHVAFTGPSGAGKSTFVMLLSRFFEPDSGSLYLAGTPLREISLHSLRSSVGIVPQDTFVLDGTIGDNLVLSAQSADRAAIDRAIRICRLGEVIERYPNGLDTRVGRGGVRLSGGEAQRLSLARAIVQNPDVLILDEALTGVEMSMEKAILADIREAFSGKTLVVITHRVDSIAGFDEHVVVRGGHICPSVEGTAWQTAAI